MAWQNPHVHFFVRAKDANGNVVTWDIEANSLSILRRTDATPDNLKVGDTVKVAGAPSRQAPNRMWALEHPRGEWTRNRARSWHHAALDEDDAIGSKSTWFEGGTAANKTAGIFRVWSTKFGEPGWLVETATTR